MRHVVQKQVLAVPYLRALPSGDLGEGKAKRKKRANARIVPTLTVDRRIRLTYRDGVRPLLRVSIGARRRGGSDHTRDGDLPGAIRKKRASTMTRPPGAIRKKRATQ